MRRDEIGWDGIVGDNGEARRGQKQLTCLHSGTLSPGVGMVFSEAEGREARSAERSSRSRAKFRIKPDCKLTPVRGMYSTSTRRGKEKEGRPSLGRRHRECTLSLSSEASAAERKYEPGEEEGPKTMQSLPLASTVRSFLLEMGSTEERSRGEEGREMERREGETSRRIA